MFRLCCAPKMWPMAKSHGNYHKCKWTIWCAAFVQFNLWIWLTQPWDRTMVLSMWMLFFMVKKKYMFLARELANILSNDCVERRAITHDDKYIDFIFASKHPNRLSSHGNKKRFTKWLNKITWPLCVVSSDVQTASLFSYYRFSSCIIFFFLCAALVWTWYCEIAFGTSFVLVFFFYVFILYPILCPYPHSHFLGLHNKSLNFHFAAISCLYCKLKSANLSSAFKVNHGETYK